MPHDLVTAIDVGTNSFHAVVASISPKGIFTIYSRDKENVRLGESYGDMKYISPEAMERGIAAMKRFAQMAARVQAPVRAIGTSAMREAINRDEFVRRVQEETGITIEVVSGNEEARLIYLGVLQALPILDVKTLIIDIGGGSTETIVGLRGDMVYGCSTKLGAIRLTQRFFTEERLSAKAVKECREYIRGEWELVLQGIQICGFEKAVASSGTAQTIASMILARRGQMSEEDDMSLNGVTLQRSEILEAVEALLQAKTVKKRMEIPGMDAKRADIIVGGALILEQAVTRLDIRELTISDYALREGILLDYYQKQCAIEHYHHLSRLRYESVVNLCDICQVDRKHAEHVRTLAVQLFDEMRLCGLHSYTETERELLEAAALLHDVGYHISSDQHHKHSYYIIRNFQLLGFTNDEKELIANIARYHRKSHPKPKHENFQRVPAVKRELLCWLAGILRIAEGLDRRHQAIVQRITVGQTPEEVLIELKCSASAGAPDIEIWSALRRVALLEEQMHKTIRFHVQLHEHI
ncbi:MAG: Ppx/GppA phosphatase family protein [Bacteroidota bacterium]|nr:Ppx/GppA family phosphatase [Candidatus Kapabacteria bacterium]MDW8221041.1 Ppx/GppA phosphatase family protein [Bacteroidota bacterium]